MKPIVKIMVSALTLAMAFAAISCSSAPKPAAQTTSPATDAAKPVNITMFYATYPHPEPDEKESLCYGVENADSVRIEPAIDRVWPAMSRCFDVPTRAATYTLTAIKGTATVSKTVSISPIAPKAKLFQVSANPRDVTAGDKVAVCYNAIAAVNVTIQPGEWFGPHGPALGCIRDQPAATTTYVVTATGAGGDRDVQKITVSVNPKP